MYLPESRYGQNVGVRIFVSGELKFKGIIKSLKSARLGIRKYNKELAYDCGFTNDEVIKLGLY